MNTKTKLRTLRNKKVKGLRKMVKQEMLFDNLSHHKNLNARWIMDGTQDDIDSFSNDIVKTADPRTSRFADIEIEATVGKSKFDKNWHTRKFDLVELFKTTTELRVDKITEKSYESLSDDERGALKNGSAIVGSTLWVNDSNRKSENIRTRTMLTFDIDEPQRSGTQRTFDEMFTHIQEVLKSIFDYDVFFFVYTSRNATQQKPRMRIMLPFDREIVEDNVKIKNKKGELVDYTDMLTSVAVSRFIASKLGIDMFDHTCHEVARLMYYPSTCSNGWFRSAVNLADILKTDDLVNAMKNDGIDITDRENWPQSKHENKVLEPLIASAKGRGDGELTEQSQKPGLIGAFNTAFPPDLAIEEFLSDVYTDYTINRYTYINGSSQGGLQYYQDTELVYSRHATDPSNNGHAHNSFDLVRIHKFGDDDESMKK